MEGDLAMNLYRTVDRVLTLADGEGRQAGIHAVGSDEVDGEHSP